MHACMKKSSKNPYPQPPTKSFIHNIILIYFKLPFPQPNPYPQLPTYNQSEGGPETQIISPVLSVKNISMSRGKTDFK